MISFACPACARPLKVKDELADKRVKCPKCAGPVVSHAKDQAVQARLLRDLLGNPLRQEKSCER